MAKLKPTADRIIGTIIRIPEGYFPKSKLDTRFKIQSKEGDQAIREAVATGKIAQTERYLYDPIRVDAALVQHLSNITKPNLPNIQNNGEFLTPPILDQLMARQQTLSAEDIQILSRFNYEYHDNRHWQFSDDELQVIQSLIERRILRQREFIVYDPLYLSASTIDPIIRREQLETNRTAILEHIKAQEGQVVMVETLYSQFGGKVPVQEVINRKDQFRVIKRGYRNAHNIVEWVTLAEIDEAKAVKTIQKLSRISSDEWSDLLPKAGEVLRPDTAEGKTPRMQVLARTYAIGRAAERLGMRTSTLEMVLGRIDNPSFRDPTGSQRLPAAEIERAYKDAEYGLRYTGAETFKNSDVAIVAGLSYSAMRYRLKKERISTTAPTWRDVQGRWGLPKHLHEFRAILKERANTVKEERLKEVREHQEHLRETERKRKEQEEILRAKLLPVFPAWEHEGREFQQVILHIGPPNSGKTYEALQALSHAGSGWYLAPLRLLAFEIFDRLNTMGVPCNLLTGEEHIPIPGAQITASTIEMFNPERSGECVIIDEAQMLADPDRGWAWTRALMEAQAPEIHVIAPVTARDLITRLTDSISIPMAVVEHQRLAPIRVAERPFKLNKLPPRTILVAFSRWSVLNLKAMLEGMGRKVSVIYGNLPPEVRRKQADRFATGETEICVATDAVGMGLNLPADYVCFYEVRKFDGFQRRTLNVGEIQQIGGRAGRFGLSEGGEVGALERQDHEVVRRAFGGKPPQLTYARVAPEVAALELLPGTLSQKLAQWSQLQSIPDHLRELLKTGDMTERVELATMLSKDEIDYIGLEYALKLVNAPTRQNTRFYWRRCVTAILEGEQMPLPPNASPQITDSLDLEITEEAIHCADIYLWLASRFEFQQFGEEELHVREMRKHWSSMIDDALINQIAAKRLCSRCGRKMPADHPYGICDACFMGMHVRSVGEDWGQPAEYPDEAFYPRPRNNKSRNGNGNGRGNGRPMDRQGGARPKYTPIARTQCYECNVKIEATGLPRLRHWQKQHPDITELTASHVAWLLGVAKEDVDRHLKFDYRQNQTRYWKMERVAQYLREKEA